jgi:hypothetical protein
MTDVLTLRWDTGFAQHTYELVGAAGADDVIGCWVMDITATQDEFNAVMMTSATWTRWIGPTAPP